MVRFEGGIRSAGITFIAVAGIAASAAISGGAATAAEVEWRYYTPLAVNDLPTELHRRFADAVEEASEGRFKIHVYGGGELPFSQQDVLRAVATGQIEVADIAVGAVAGDAPELNAFAMPFVCTSIDAFYEKAAEAAEPYVTDVLTSRFGVEALMQWVMPQQQLWLRRPIEGIDDIAGLKVRAWNREQVEMMELLGGTGIYITPTEVIPALQRGVVDGAFTSAVGASNWNMHEVTSFGFLIDLNLAHQVVAVNGAALEALPDDLREILFETADRWRDTYRVELTSGTEEAHRHLESGGMTLREATSSEIDQLREITRPMWEEWAADQGDTGHEMLSAVADACQ